MKTLYATLILLVLCSCSGGGDDGGGDPVVPAPQAAQLIFPANNELCMEGEVISPTKSRITFQWEPAQNADSYTLKLRQLALGSESTHATEDTELTLELDRGVAYAWQLISRSQGNPQTAESLSWRFYNAGPPQANYAPFPPYGPQPAMGSALDAGALTLQWESADLDGDALTHSVYLGTENPPTVLLGETQEQQLTATVATNTVYYWQVVCQDVAGNASASEVFQFRTNP